MDNGVLIHVKPTNLGREMGRVVVPKQRRLLVRPWSQRVGGWSL